MMKKITGSLVKLRFVLPVLMLILAVTVAFAVFFCKTCDISALMALTVFLPEDSSVKKGIEILEEEFDNVAVEEDLNCIVVLYDTQEEPHIADMIKKLEKNREITSVAAYANTLGRPYTADEMAERIPELPQKEKWRSWMIDLVYFDRSGCETSSMLLGDFLGVLEGSAEEDWDLLPGLDDKETSKWELLKIFADPIKIEKSRTAAEIAEILGIEGSLATEVFRTAGRSRMNFVTFFQAAENAGGQDISVPSELLEQIALASLFTDPEEYTKGRTAAELSQIFEVEESVVSGLFLLSRKKTMSIEELIGTVSSNPLMLSMIPPEITAKLYMVDILTDPEEMSQKRTAAEISELFGIELSLLSAVMGDKSMSISELMQMAWNPPEKPDMTSITSNGSLAWVQRIMRDTENSKVYEPFEIAQLLAGVTDKIDENRIMLVYRLYYSQNTPLANTLSEEQFYAHILAMSKKSEYEGLFDAEMKRSVSKAARDLAISKRQFIGEEHSIMRIEVLLPEKSKEMRTVLETLQEELADSLSGNHYMVGKLPLQQELAEVLSQVFIRIGIAMVVIGAILWVMRLLSGKFGMRDRVSGH